MSICLYLSSALQPKDYSGTIRIHTYICMVEAESVQEATLIGDALSESRFPEDEGYLRPLASFATALDGFLKTKINTIDDIQEIK